MMDMTGVFSVQDVEWWSDFPGYAGKAITKRYGIRKGNSRPRAGVFRLINDPKAGALFTMLHHDGFRFVPVMSMEPADTPGGKRNTPRSGDGTRGVLRAAENG